MTELPHKWTIGAEAAGSERLDLAPKHVYFYWKGGWQERYSEQQLKEKIDSEGRTEGDPFFEAYEELVGLARHRGR